MIRRRSAGELDTFCVAPKKNREKSKKTIDTLEGIHDILRNR